MAVQPMTALVMRLEADEIKRTHIGSAIAELMLLDPTVADVVYVVTTEILRLLPDRYAACAQVGGWNQLAMDAKAVAE